MFGSESSLPRQNLPVLFLPDALLPAEIAFRYVLESFQGDIEIILKDLEVYKENAPPRSYSLDTEILGIKKAIGDKVVHLVGFSGGAAIGLGFLTKYSDQVKSLALIEPAWVGNENLTQFEIEYWLQMDKIWKLPIEERMNAFVNQNLRVGVPPPPPLPDPAPSWFSLRPAGFSAMGTAFRRAKLCTRLLSDYDRPVYLALGGLSHSIEQYKADRLLSLFPHIRLEVFPQCHHFDPPHRLEPQRFASVLERFWADAELADGIIV